MPLVLNCNLTLNSIIISRAATVVCCVFGCRMFLISFLLLSKPYLHSDRWYECRHFYPKTKKLFTQWNCFPLKFCYKKNMDYRRCKKLKCTEHHKFSYYAKSINFDIQAEGLRCLTSVVCILRSQSKYSSKCIAESF
jgi:hypothetical protein